MRKIQLTSFFFVFSVAFFSCKKEDLPLADGSRIKTIVSKWHDSLSYTSFQYDIRNKLKAQIDSNNNGHKRSMWIEYDAQDRPIKITNASTYNGVSNNAFPEQSYSFIYDANGRIIKKVAHAPVTYVNLTRNSYTYDAKGRLITDTIHSYWANEIFGYVTYTYDSNDNLVERKKFDKWSGTMQIQETMQASYDTKTNPCKDLGVFLYIINENDLYLSKNNRTSGEYQTGTRVSFDYDYNNTGLPIRLSIRDNTDPSITYLDFFYE